MSRTLFSVDFRSPMGDEDLLRLHRSLDMVTYLSPKPGVAGAQPGVAKLDEWSGLFLVRGEAEGEWALEARTWGDPPAEAVNSWRHLAALAARELDSGVDVPAAVVASRASAPDLRDG
jgi:hypothetical protein